MLSKVFTSGKALSTFRARIRSLSRVCPKVNKKVSSFVEALPTHRASKWGLSSVHDLHVFQNAKTFREELSAFRTRMPFPSSVGLHVSSYGSSSCVGLSTYRARIGPLFSLFTLTHVICLVDLRLHFLANDFPNSELDESLKLKQQLQLDCCSVRVVFSPERAVFELKKNVRELKSVRAHKLQCFKFISQPTNKPTNNELINQSH